MYEILVKLTCINRTPLYSEHTMLTPWKLRTYNADPMEALNTMLTPWKLRTHNADPMEAQFRQVALYF
jgi:hypothetical protein